MPQFDITQHILAPRNRLPEITQWLTDNVGPFYGRGEDPVMQIGSGWEISVVRDVDHDENIVIGWSVDITDESKSILFALTFCGPAI